MARCLLPIGIQSFRKLRESNCYYVDKTGYALRLAGEGTHYFLSRPRRFGKSLFLDTLKELFEGSRELFEGLHAYDHWDWSVRHPVTRLSFGSGNFKEAGYLHSNLMAQFDAIEEEAGVESRYDTGPERFGDLIRTLHRRAGQRLAVLVDEYDKPILDALEKPGIARANRDYLRGLYATIKDCDAHVRFCFLTGVSKFSKVSLFSGLNNLIDITLESPYSALCGYTEEDLGTVFAPELPGLDRERVRDWYKGYSWGGEEKVYNPFDALLLFRTREFKAWWFETGTPTFLVETLVERGVASPTLDGMVATDELLSTFDVGDIAAEALLFQTGYLTVVGNEIHEGNQYYRLGYPNREVRQEPELQPAALSREGPIEPDAEYHPLEPSAAGRRFRGSRAIVSCLLREHPLRVAQPQRDRALRGLLRERVLLVFFAGLGLEVTVEDSGSGGRLDMAVRAGGRVYLFEFKVLERAGPGAAMVQLKERGYADKYRHLSEPVHLVAVEFSTPLLD